MENEMFDFNKEELFETLNKKDVVKLRSIIENYNIIDIAEALNELDNIQDYLFVFKYISPEFTADIFSYLEQERQEELIRVLTSEQLNELIENLYSDDLVDFIQELPANLITKILQATDKERRTIINQLLSYSEDTAGGIMTTEFIMLREDYLQKEAMQQIKLQAGEAEIVSSLFVVDSKRQLKGTLTIKDILYMEDNQTIKDVMEKDLVYCLTSDDQEEVANTFKKYDKTALPVTTKDNRLVGIITSDDIIDVIEQEATEDIHMMANINPLEDEYIKTSAFALAKKGVLWIIILMLLSTFTSLIMNKFEDAMYVVPALSIFIPMLIDTAGNAGNQSTALVIRALGLGEISVKDYLRVVSKELLTSLLVGVCVGIVNCLWIVFLAKTNIIDLSLSMEGSSITPLKLGMLVGLSMIFCILFSKFIGASLPMLCQLIKIDPALLAGPMVTTLVDATSIIIYFIIAGKIFSLF